jgi:S-DNA-T family DNA segregation ATPase FtsK/SpoIIIE
MTELIEHDTAGIAEVVDLPVAATTTDVVPAPEVIEGELVDEAEYVELRRRRRLTDTLPVLLQDRDAAREMGREMAVRTARSPLSVLGAVGRGLVVSGRAWRRWVGVREIHEVTKDAGKLADKWQEIRALSVYRWKITGGTAVGSLVGLGVADLALGSPVLWATGGVASCGLALAGRHKDGSPGRKAVLTGGRSLAWTMNGDNLVDAFRAAGVIKAGEGLMFVTRPSRESNGWSVTVDLPPGRKASAAIARREDLATALAVDEAQLDLARVRGNRGHAGRLALWVCDSDPYDQAPLEWTLADCDEFDLWSSIPFGVTGRGSDVDLPLVWTSLLVGAIPRQGKTYAARIPVTAAALDPHVRLVVFDGKGGKDWRPFELVAHRFGKGDDPATVARLVEALEEAVADVQRRFAALSEMDDDLCPESKLTPEISRNPKYDMPLVVIALDEVQVYLEDETHGKRVLDLLTYLVKKGPAAGYMLVLATQKPDAQTIPDKLRGQIGTRFALKVMTWQASETILGAGTYKAGMDASKLLEAHKGVGLLLGADGETALSAGEAVTVRTYKLEIADVRRACQRGRELRLAAGTLTGDAAGETALVADHQADVEDRMPGRLRAADDYLADHANGRTFVPTAELVDALDLAGDTRAATQFGRSMRSWGCAPKQGWVTEDDGRRQVRGYNVADVRAAVERIEAGGPVVVIAEAS